MASKHPGPIIVARLHDGKMQSVCYFTTREVGAALAYITSVSDAGDTVNVTIADTDDRSGISDLDRRKLTKGAKR